MLEAQATGREAARLVFASEGEAKAYVRAKTREYLAGRGIDAGPNKLFKCLNPAHGDKTPSMCLNHRTSRVRCFGCGADYDVFGLIGLELGLSGNEMIRAGYRMFGVEVAGRPGGAAAVPAGRSAAANAAAARGQERAERDLVPYFRECAARLGETGYPASRGLDPAVLERFWVGYDPRLMGGALVIPTGKGSFAARSVDPKAAGGDRHRKIGRVRVFNWKAVAREKRPLFVVEGEIDALSVMSAGGKAIAMGGAANGPSLLRLLQSSRPAFPLVLALDNDKSGEAAAGGLSVSLSKMGALFLKAEADLYGACKDANEALIEDVCAFAGRLRAVESMAMLMR